MISKRIKNIFLLIFLTLPLSVLGQKKYAMLVGISNYNSIDKNTEWTNIHGVNDVNLIEPILQKQGFNIDKVLDSNATKANITKHLKSLIRKSEEGSIVYLHFSTHGQPFEDLDGDELDGWDESIVPVDAPLEYKKKIYEGNNHLIDDELNKYAEQIRSKIGAKGHLYIIIDACHAGKSSRGLEDIFLTRGTKRGFSPNGKLYKAKKEIATHYNLTSSPQKSHVTFLEACGNTQVNMEIKRNGTYYGPLSYYIANTLTSYNLTSDNRWVYQVQKLMRKDINVQDQDMIIETSMKK